MAIYTLTATLQTYDITGVDVGLYGGLAVDVPSFSEAGHDISPAIREARQRGMVHRGWIENQFDIYVKKNGAAVDLSAATELTLDFIDPAGATSTKTPTFVNDGTDGRIQYAIQPHDFMIEGKWQYRYHFFVAGNYTYSPWHSFIVEKFW